MFPVWRCSLFLSKLSHYYCFHNIFCRSFFFFFRFVLFFYIHKHTHTHSLFRSDLHFIASQCVKPYSIVHNFLQIISTVNGTFSQEVKQAADILKPLHNFGFFCTFILYVSIRQWITTKFQVFCNFFLLY